jgi:hypothetical protein
MLIKNTDGAHCKIKNIKVSGTTAYITAIMYSSVHQTSEDKMGNIHRVFSFYLNTSAPPACSLILRNSSFRSAEA